MTDEFELSRRKLLAGLGTAGVAAAGAGLGTTAYLSDTESFDGNVMTAGTLDLLIGYHSVWDQGIAGSGSVSGTQNGDGTLHAELGDVKPGDSGALALCPRIDTNPAYLWLCGELTENAENGFTEPEAEVDETEGPMGGELAESVMVDVDYCELPVEGEFPADADTVANVWEGTLAGFLAAIEGGVALDGAAGDGDGQIGFPTPGEQDCFAGSDADEDNYCLCVEWELPTDVGNEIQGDSLEFDLRFFAEQCRHNDGTGNPCCNCGPDEVAVSLPDGTRQCVPVWQGEDSVADFYAFSPHAAGNPAIQEEGTTNLFVYDDGSGARSLVVVHDVADDVIDGSDADGGTVSGTFTGLASGADWQVRDDNSGNDSYSSYPISGSSTSVDWTWSSQYTDGGAIGPLAPDFDVGVDLELDDGIDTVQYLTQSGDAVTIGDDVEGDDVSTRIASCASEPAAQ